MNTYFTILRCRFPIFGNFIRILYASDGTLTKLHLIASQCSSLVGEYVFDLAQLFDERGCATVGGGIGLVVIDVQVGADEECLSVFDNLDGDEE